MKKRIDIRIALFILAICFFTLHGSAQAAVLIKHEIVPLTPGSKVMQQASSAKTIGNDLIITYYRYQVKAPSEGYLTMTIKGGGGGVPGKLMMSKSKGNEDSFAADAIVEWNSSDLLAGTPPKSITVRVPVSKGTYYFFSGRSSGGDIIVCNSFTKITQPKNYTKKKALTLKAKKKVIISQTEKTNRDRWFKIRLTTSRKIRVHIADMRIKEYPTQTNGQITLFNSKGKTIALRNSKMNHYTTKKLAKGTYYLCISKDDFSTMAGVMRSVVQVYWD